MVLRSRRRDIRPTPTGPRVNRDIRVDQVRVIDEEGEQMGILSIDEAVQTAEDRFLDLVEVAPNSDPPVCKIMDYGRYKYTQQKKGKEAKRRQKIVELKEVKMRIKIDSHDYEFKKNHAERFLLDGNKAKVTIMFRGREVTHPDLGRKILDRVANDLEELGVVEQSPILEGRNMTMILAPTKEAAAKAREASLLKAKSGKKAHEKVEEQEGALTVPLADNLPKAAEGSAEPEDAPPESTEEQKTEEGTADAEA